MIDLKEMFLPGTVEVNGKNYDIHTSFKYWLCFLEMLKEKNTKLKDYDFMYINKIPVDRAGGLTALMAFGNPPQTLPRQEEFNSTAEKAVDYNEDSDYIFAAFMEQYGIDLVESEMHWYKFLALFKGLNGTKLNEIIGFRLYENTSGKSDSYTRQMEKLRRAWELPEEEEYGEDEALEAFEARLKK
ncbi:MAG: bacteriophage Gp15 family protein [Treponemataceae bacterium]|nr:bacteriophage Gp15 family protein [Treponemataceae bacterium]